MVADLMSLRGEEIEVEGDEAQAGTMEHRFKQSSTMINRRTSKVRFDLSPTYYANPDELTAEEIEASWWTASEIRSTKRVCRWIAGEARRLGYTAQIVNAVGHITTARKFCVNLDVGADPIDSLVAKRFVRCSSHFTTLRGLECRICATFKQHSKSFRARVCRIQRMPGMNDEYLRRVSQNFSRFDRILARLLGEADAFSLLESRLHDDMGSLQQRNDFRSCC